MSRKILIFFFISFFLFAKDSIENKIYYSKKALYKKEKSIKGLNSKLEKIAKDIKRIRKDLNTLEKRLKSLEEELKDKDKSYKISQKRIKEIQKKESELLKEQNRLKEQLTLLIAKYFSKSILLDNFENNGVEDILNQELIKALQKSEKEKIEKLSLKYTKTTSYLESEQKTLERLKKEIALLDKKREELKRVKSQKKESLKLLKYKKNKYKEEIEKLLKEQKSLRETLNRLQIIKSQKSKKRKNVSLNIKVKKIGKSYQNVKTLRYRGPKTIAPLDRFVITKKYGSYIDPIYNIKIFNESIELKPLDTSAKVKNVLNGRVILAKRTPHLDNVVIVKHKGGLYTIYAHIDKIAPTIRKGKKVKKGYVIGRVYSKLTFEVTKNNYHINPLDLIKVR